MTEHIGGEGRRSTLVRLQTEAASNESRLRKEADYQAKARRFWESLIEHDEAGNAAHVCAAMEKHRDVLRALREGADEAVPELEDLWRDAKSRVAEMVRRYPGLLERRARERGLPLDQQSRHPKYTFDGFIQLDIDDKAFMASVRTPEGKPTKIPFDLDPVLDLVGREHTRLFGGRPASKTLLKKLRAAYLAVVRHREMRDGDSAPIREVMEVMGKKDRKFRADEFLVQLSTLVQDQQVIDGRRLDLQQTKDSQTGVLLRGSAGRAYVGFVTFTLVQQ
jgi:hypothetical protein